MIKSMTGFASLTQETDVATVSVTVRSVNNRYRDVQVRVPHAMETLEHPIRELVNQRVARGRVDLNVNIQFNTRPAVKVEVDEHLITALVEAATRSEVARISTGKWAVGELLRFPQVVTVYEQPRERQECAGIEAAVMVAVEKVIVALNGMRLKEGEFLREDLDQRLTVFRGLVDRISQCASKGDDVLRDRLMTRVAELNIDAATDPDVVSKEIVRFVAKSDIHEELARLHAHISHWVVLAHESEPCGRKLDFLLQEMNREINTIGSKAEGTETSVLVVTAKAELEKLREQIQNVE